MTNYFIMPDDEGRYRIVNPDKFAAVFEQLRRRYVTIGVDGDIEYRLDRYMADHSSEPEDEWNVDLDLNIIFPGRAFRDRFVYYDIIEPTLDPLPGMADIIQRRLNLT